MIKADFRTNFLVFFMDYFAKVGENEKKVANRFLFTWENDWV